MMPILDYVGMGRGGEGSRAVHKGEKGNDGVYERVIVGVIGVFEAQAFIGGQSIHSECHR